MTNNPITMITLRKAIKESNNIWTEDLAKTILNKHDQRDKGVTSAAFFKQLGLKNMNRLYYWRKVLDSSTKTVNPTAVKKIATSLEPIPHVDSITIKKGGALYQGQMEVSTGHHSAIRLAIEHMSRDLRDLSTSYPAVKKYIDSIREEMGKLVHHTVDIEFNEPGQVIDIDINTLIPSAAAKQARAKHANG